MNNNKQAARSHPLKPFTLTLLCMSLFAANTRAELGNPRVNQIGYLPKGIKIASYKTTSTNAQTWQLKQNGTLISSGQTNPSGVDAASGDNLQQIDLSGVTATGTGFTLTIGSDTSYPFSISSTAFRGAFYDSLKYFYHNRSGIAINTAYTGGGNGSYATNAKWSRPAGHLNAGINKGDMNVPCWSGTCNYSLNVTKGWYDAGDHGKYVVNGGISVWTLLNMYERAQHLNGTSNTFGDGTLNIPESSNGISDLLDEARWELEFLVAMQVPAGQTKAGMVHHKMHDVGWTGLPLAPHEDDKQRALVPPSTAATLNLAAVAAQAARIWKNIDSSFSSSCLTAAQKAWDAAKANPNELYSGNYDNGGGGYGDKTVTDEFYWAAAELYITTGDAKYLPTISAYAITKTDASWADTELLGLASLATVSTTQTTSLRANAQQKIASIATIHLNTQNASGYSTPLSTQEYYWGSNGGVANKLMLMGLAYDFTKNEDYAKGVGKGLDYLLGRNTFSTSFVTGEGSKTMLQPHHRFWAEVLNNRYPSPPPGALSGGPNSGLQDGTASGLLSACVSKPASCWVDNIQAYSVNEITINWNAPLAWALNFYNDYANTNSNSSQLANSSKSSVTNRSSVQSSIRSSIRSSVKSSIASSVRSSVASSNSPSSIAVSSVRSSVSPSSTSSSSTASTGNCTYVVSNEWNTGFTAVVRIKNNRNTVINGWNINWTYSDGSKITNSWNGIVTGTNPYNAVNLSWNGNIQPGQSVEMGVQGTKGTNTNAQVPLITGTACN
jgi:endoglucanase